MARFHAGRLRHRIVILEKVATQNDYGEEIITWTSLGSYWASVEPIRGREYTEMRQAQAEVTHRIRMRALSGISPTMRVEYAGRTFDITSVIEVNERGRELQLMCNERVDY